jgi:hypothetical protein
MWGSPAFTAGGRRMRPQSKSSSTRPVGTTCAQCSATEFWRKGLSPSSCRAGAVREHSATPIVCGRSGAGG